MNFLRDFWFKNEKIWFNSSPEDDIRITQMFSRLHSSLLVSTYNPQEFTLEKIILADQITRHIYRNLTNIWTKYQSYAILHANYALSTPIFMDKLLPQERIFVLLPFRHTKDKLEIKKTINLVIKWNNKNNKYYNRFLRAAYLQLGKIINSEIIPTHVFLKNIPHDLIDPESPKRYEFNLTNDYYKLFQHNLVTKFYNATKKYISPNTSIIISLSGGVDSMVLAWLFKYVYKRTKITAIHIDYANRPSSIFERDFVVRHANMWKIPIMVRAFTEFTREIAPTRKIYEEVTKLLRYDMYTKEQSEQSYTVLGHHKDDVFENILNNIKKKKNPQNIKSMPLLTTINNVRVMRPLIDITKEEIVNFANDITIPYLKDSTPPTSERGTIRDFKKNIPDQYVNAVHDFAEMYSNMYNTIESQITIPFFDYIIKNKKDFHTHIEYTLPLEYENQKLFQTWKYVLHNISPQHIIPPSNKSIKSFLVQLHNKLYPKKINKFHFTKYMYFKNNCIVVLN